MYDMCCSRDGEIENVEELEEPFIDDYIAMHEPIAAYLTRFSGIVPGDLDPAVSPHHVITLKVKPPLLS